MARLWNHLTNSYFIAAWVPAISGFQQPTLGPVRNFDVASGELVQILHTGNNHRVSISSTGCEPGYVNLFDSLYDSVMTQEVEEQTNDLLGPIQCSNKQMAVTVEF